MRLSSFPEWMGQRRARKDTAELLSLSKSHCSHPQSGCNSTNSWFLSLKGICLRTFFSLSCFISQRQAGSKRKTLRSTLENQYRERTHIPYCFQISHTQKVTLFADKSDWAKVHFLYKLEALLFSSSFQFLHSRSHPSRKLSGSCAFLGKPAYEGIFCC